MNLLFGFLTIFRTIRGQVQAIGDFCPGCRNGGVLAPRTAWACESDGNDAIQNLRRPSGSGWLNRSTRRVSVTPDGAAYYDSVSRSWAWCVETEDRWATTMQLLRGVCLRVDVPNVVARSVFVPALPSFSRYPDIELALACSEPREISSRKASDCAVLEVAKSRNPTSWATPRGLSLFRHWRSSVLHSRVRPAGNIRRTWAAPPVSTTSRLRTAGCSNWVFRKTPPACDFAAGPHPWSMKNVVAAVHAGLGIAHPVRSLAQESMERGPWTWCRRLVPGALASVCMYIPSTAPVRPDPGVRRLVPRCE